MKKYPQYKMVNKIGPREAPRMPEIPQAPEIKPEMKPEKLPLPESREGVPPPAPLKSAGIAPSGAPRSPKEPALLEIENILSTGLLDVYKGLSPELQKEFKQEGERVASKIRQMMIRARLRVSQILQMIRNWLAIIPGVNKFFLEQEAKIKTDKIIELAEKKH